MRHGLSVLQHHLSIKLPAGPSEADAACFCAPTRTPDYGARSNHHLSPAFAGAAAAAGNAASELQVVADSICPWRFRGVEGAFAGLARLSRHQQGLVQVAIGRRCMCGGGGGATCCVLACPAAASTTPSHL